MRTRSRNRAARTARRVMANVWMHNGFLQVEGEKMSKSLGNFITINELLETGSSGRLAGRSASLCDAETHYRQPIDWTYESAGAKPKFSLGSGLQTRSQNVSTVNGRVPVAAYVSHALPMTSTRPRLLPELHKLIQSAVDVGASTHRSL